MKTAYTNLYEITALQQKIIRYIDYWAHTEKTPISRKKVFEEMQSKKEAFRSIDWSLGRLLELGYLRRAEGTSNKTYYVLLRRI